MSTKIYVGNLPWSSGEEDLKQLFAEFGQVENVSIPKDRETGRPRGFAFVTMADEGMAKTACEALNEQEYNGRNLRVNLAISDGSRGPQSRPATGGWGERQEGRGGYGQDRRGGYGQERRGGGGYGQERRGGYGQERRGGGGYGQE